MTDTLRDPRRGDLDRLYRAEWGHLLSSLIRAALLDTRFGCVPAEVDSLLALMLLHDARRETRVAEDGELVLLEDQDTPSRPGLKTPIGRKSRGCMRACSTSIHHPWWR